VFKVGLIPAKCRFIALYVLLLLRFLCNLEQGKPGICTRLSFFSFINWVLSLCITVLWFKEDLNPTLGGSHKQLSSLQGQHSLYFCCLFQSQPVLCVGLTHGWYKGVDNQNVANNSDFSWMFWLYTPGVHQCWIALGRFFSYSQDLEKTLWEWP